MIVHFFICHWQDCLVVRFKLYIRNGFIVEFKAKEFFNVSGVIIYHTHIPNFYCTVIRHVRGDASLFHSHSFISYLCVFIFKEDSFHRRISYQQSVRFHQRSLRLKVFFTCCKEVFFNGWKDDIHYWSFVVVIERCAAKL